MSYRLVDHTADLAIESDAPDPGACLAEAARGLAEVLTGRPPDARLADRPMAFAVEAPDHVALAVAFLAELVWLMESEDLLWLQGGVRMTHAADGILRAEADGNGTRFEASRHGRGVEVKAVTYHQVRFEADARGTWHLRVLLDL